MLQTLPVMAMQKKPPTPHELPQLFLTFMQLPAKVPSYWNPTISTAWSTQDPTAGQVKKMPLRQWKKAKWPANMAVGTVQQPSTAAALLMQLQSGARYTQPLILQVVALALTALQLCVWPSAVLGLVGQTDLSCSPQQVAYQRLNCKSPPEQLRLQWVSIFWEEQSVISCTDRSTPYMPLTKSRALMLATVAQAQQLPQMFWLQMVGVQGDRSLEMVPLTFQN